MRRDCAPVEETAMLEPIVERMQESGCTLIPVSRQGRIVGMISLDNIGDLVMVRRAIESRPGPSTVQHPRRP